MGTPITRGSNDHPVRDRLGNTPVIVTRKPANGFSTVTARNSIRPYGNHSGSTGRWVFGTYEQGSSADYADQPGRKNDVGRFTAADLYQASGGTRDAGSWNRYSYVGGDPVNFNDPFGLDKTAAGSCAEARAQALAAGGSDFFCFSVTGTGSAPSGWRPDYNSDSASDWYRAQMPDVLAQNQPVINPPSIPTGTSSGPSAKDRALMDCLDSAATTFHSKYDPWLKANPAPNSPWCRRPAP